MERSLHEHTITSTPGCANRTAGYPAVVAGSQAQDERQALAGRIREARVRNGWTQAQVEEWSGLPRGVVAQFEAASRAPSFENLIRLANGLRVSTDWLLGLDPGPRDAA